MGPSAAGRALSEGAVISAVVASVRHVDTPYGRLLMSGVSRYEAWRRIAPTVEAVLGARQEQGQQDPQGRSQEEDQDQDQGQRQKQRQRQRQGQTAGPGWARSG
ncbi:DUF2293 domain-containing protein [Streptomyces sp. NPDC056734]|uniref:DUF2293 domain-containing protein n=1 Tax=Streptomyces sp. NPDC056734 TaxID=3345931 RepID=UPI003679C7B1